MINGDTPTVFFFDLNKTCKMMMRVAPEANGSPIVELYDGNGPRVALSLDADGASSVRLFGKTHKGGIALSVTEEGIPRLDHEQTLGRSGLALPEGTKPAEPEDDSSPSHTDRPSR